MNDLTPQSPPAGDDELDIILWHVQQAAFDQEGLADSSVAKIKAQLNAYILAEIRDLIGEDLPIPTGPRAAGKTYAIVANRLKAEQRRAAQARFGGEGE